MFREQDIVGERFKILIVGNYSHWHHSCYDFNIWGRRAMNYYPSPYLYKRRVAFAYNLQYLSIKDMSVVMRQIYKN